ncbi:MAG TPA: chemotaxis protein CheW [Thermoanaerobaculia bacterium]|nr:chemotaxis protein CheW [Thermoanaerobaculia bacterium]
MVDLVKIRKKKAEGRKQKAEAEAAAPEQKVAAAEAQSAAPRTADVASAGPPASAPAAPAVALPLAELTGPTKLEKFKQEAGKRRDVGSVQAVEETTGTQLELLTFIIAGEQYAVDIERIVEIVTPRAHTRIPNADSSVVGIISLRGTIVTLVDVRRKLRHTVVPVVNADTRVVVIDFQHEIVGFVVDRVLRVVKIAAGEIEPHPVVHATELDDSIRGVFRTAGALTILLDLDKLLDHRALAAQTA